MLANARKSVKIAASGGKKQTIIAVGLEVLVRNATAENLRHVLRIEGGRIIPLASCSTVWLVAAILGKEDGDGVVLEEINDAVVARGFKVRVAAPLVDIVAEKLDRVRLVTAVEVVGNVVAEVRRVVCSVANAQVLVALVLDVLLHVARGGLDVGRGVCVGAIVGDFVSDKEANDIGVFGKVVNDLGIVVVEVDGPLRVIAVNGLVGVAQVGNDVDAGVVEQLHAVIVVAIGVDAIGSDDVGVEVLEERHVSLAFALADERVGIGGVGGCGAAARRAILLVSNALDEELAAVFVEKFGALRREREENDGVSWCEFLGVPSRSLLGIVLGIEASRRRNKPTLIEMGGRSSATALLAAASRGSKTLEMPILKVKLASRLYRKLMR